MYIRWRRTQAPLRTSVPERGPRMLHPVRLVGLLFGLTLTMRPAQASKQAGAMDEAWSVTAAEIPMRDGVKLHTLIAAPRHPAVPMPFLMRRTPYGTPDDVLASPLSADDVKDLSGSG